MIMLRRRAALVLLATICLACERADKSSGGETSSDDDKKRSSGGEKATSSERGKTTKAVATAKEKAPDPLATFFTEPPDPEVKLLRMGRVPKQPVTLRLPPGWPVPVDEEGYDLDWTLFTDKRRHARIYVGVEPKANTLSEQKMKLGTQHVGVSNATFGKPVKGHFGASKKPATIAKGTAKMHKKPAEIWYAFIDLNDKEMLVVFASLRKDVYPKLEKQIHAILRSLKFNA